MNGYDFFNELLRAETEEDVENILEANGYLNYTLDNWHPLDDNENNWSTVGAQHNNATGALVEKIINAVDAVLIRGCCESGIDPESDDAPKTMVDAARDLFGVRNGRLDSITAAERTMLAENIHIVATGPKKNPNYLIIDSGEGQTPKCFASTFLSLRGKNKYGIPFVQGINNCGGSAVLRFCGEHKYQLLMSRRHPACPRDADDETAELWGFTLVRSLWPEAQRRRRPMYVYLAPGREIATFSANDIRVLPEVVAPKQPVQPYAGGLKYGTCVKLYNYKWSARSIATTNAREELEKQLYSLALPVRISESRGYDKTNYFQTTLSGQAVNIATHREGKRGGRVEDDFNQVPLNLSLPGIGELHVFVTIYRVRDDEGEAYAKKRIPRGTIFTVNGQVHERLAQGFVRDKLNYAWLSDYMLISIDCTEMDPKAHAALFSTSRDRTIEGDIRRQIINEIVNHLSKGDSPLRSALRELNARRRQDQLKTLNDEEPMRVLEGLVKSAPSLAAIFGPGERIPNPWIPDDIPVPFVGKRFPTYFELVNEPKGGLVKNCPIDRTCRVQFETDAVNDFFDRSESPGLILFNPVGMNRAWNLHNGKMSVTFQPPPNSHVDDEIPMEVEVSDESQIEPFICRFTMRIGEAAPDRPPRPPRPQSPSSPRGGSKLAMPHIFPVTKDGREIDGEPSISWGDQNEFNEYTAIELKPSGEDGKFDIFINMDNIHLYNELRRERKTSEHPLIAYYFKYGMAIVAMGMLHEYKRQKTPSEGSGKPTNSEEQDTNGSDYLKEINDACKGIATVIVPVVQRLSASAEKTLATV